MLIQLRKEYLLLRIRKLGTILDLIKKKLAQEYFLHAGGIFSTSGSPHLLTKTVNTVVLTIAVALFPNFKLKEFWIEFGSGLHRINISMHGIYQEIGRMLRKNFYFST